MDDAVVRSKPKVVPRNRAHSETGVEHQVDHIKPLILGGQHVATNLEVITGAANRTKAKAERAEARRRRRAVLTA
jgi:5-methylcytosine-specific restriction endonuclease McrA